MKCKYMKSMNIYVTSGIIGGFSFLYIISFAFLQGNISKGSSLQRHQAAIAKQHKKMAQHNQLAVN